mgnify:FL=1
MTFWKLTATTYSYGTSDWTAEMRYPYTQEQQTEQVTVSETVVSAPTTVTSQPVELSYVGGLPDDMIKTVPIMIPPRQISFPLFRAVMQEPITMYYL